MHAQHLPVRHEAASAQLAEPFVLCHVAGLLLASKLPTRRLASFVTNGAEREEQHEALLSLMMIYLQIKVSMQQSQMHLLERGLQSCRVQSCVLGPLQQDVEVTGQY